jgi:hypothetical protein
MQTEKAQSTGVYCSTAEEPDARPRAQRYRSGDHDHVSRSVHSVRRDLHAPQPQGAPGMIDPLAAHAGLKATLFDDGFALAIVAACVAGAFTAACAVVAIWYAIADVIERIAA